MGMFDHIRCEWPMPDGREVKEDAFQTKSLWNLMDRFTITAAGRLILHHRRYFLGSDETARMPESVADIDLEYHGDLEIHGPAVDGNHLRYAVRFTHGSVEWIRPLEALPEFQRKFLIEKGC